MRYHWYLVGRLQLVLALSRYVARFHFARSVNVDSHAVSTHICTPLHLKFYLSCIVRSVDFPIVSIVLLFTSLKRIIPLFRCSLSLEDTL